MRPLLPILLAALALAGCGDDGGEAPSAAQRERFTLVLDYFPNADHAGVYAAEAAGEFRKANLDVDIQTPPDPAAPLKLLQAGKADAVISYEPELLLARDKGARLVSVGAVVQKPLTSLMWLPGSKIEDVDDLAGKRVGTAGIPYQSAYLKTVLENAGVDPASVKETNVGFNLGTAMVSGKVAATLGAFWNYEGTDLRLRGRKPVIRRMEELGVPTYNELVLVARRDDLDTAGAARMRRFLQALARGHRIVDETPELAVDALLAANPDLERRLQTEVIRVTTPEFFPEDESQPWGFQDERLWHRYGDWMFRNGLLKRQPNAEDAMTNEFLPGQGLEQPRTNY